MPDLPDNVAATIRRHGLLQPGESVVLAVSGGADSVAMLAAMAELAGRRGNLWRLHVAHLDHGIRGEAGREDARFVADLAGRFAMPVTVEAADVPALAAAEGRGIEEAGRCARYDVLARVATEASAAAVATAHTADDQAETVLHRICRGTGLKGLCGIPLSRPLAEGVRLIRPLLEVRRDEVLAFLAARGLSYRRDETNADPAATRNRLRHEVLPLLAERINPRIVEALTRLAASAADAWAEAGPASELLLSALVCRRGEGEIVLDAPGLSRLARPVAAEVLRRAIESLGASLGGLGQGHLAAILDLSAAGRGGRRLDLPGRLSAAMVRGRLTLAARGGKPRG